ncbi:RDD family protein [Pseudooceanicola sediminis]|uniref:RDD family protein n=1 Tax=Pseudooceanicola sediminis TaxID=2211117 RepID=A0A399J5R6_9RHOB|nr:RDD family protein [Pseudooceanicola sediminis]KAA2316798.1 RDD family protein [Puniceibacterium sp. HSS470]RII40745.1 RDD family protein [Pseudooceanicola sediminis]|tara:strand:+ start:222297 stop:222731 length:435 start_codon:yes stop_codon:yes gene_type:complete
MSLPLPDPDHSPEFYDSVAMKRGFAWIVDAIVITLIALVIVPLTAFIGAFFFPVLLLTVSFFYRWMTIAGRSATWGMRLMSIELRSTEGHRLTPLESLLHTLGFTVSFALPILQVISVVLMLTSRYGQGLTDHVLGTTAVNRRA